MSLRLLQCLMLVVCCFLGNFAAAQDEGELWVDVDIDKGDDATYYSGEPIFISCITGDDAYVVIYNIDSEGRLHLIYPGSPDQSGFMPANETYQIPEEDDDYSLKVTGIHGEEFICAIASSVPLRIPSIFGEEAQFSVDGDPVDLMHDIAEDMIDGQDAPYAVDMSHFYIGNEKECGDFPPIPPFPIPPFRFGCLQVISKPGGARVYLNGKYFGKTPTVIAGIPPGTHELVVKKKRYYLFCEDIYITEGEKERVKVRLKWKLF